MPTSQTPQRTMFQLPSRAKFMVKPEERKGREEGGMVKALAAVGVHSTAGCKKHSAAGAGAAVPAPVWVWEQAGARTIVEGQWPLPLQGLGKGVQYAAVHAGRRAWASQGAVGNQFGILHNIDQSRFPAAPS